MSVRGKLFGIGVGPGDPELLTLKAIKTIKECDVIAVPKAGEGEGTAFSIIEQYLDNKDLIECGFAMDKDMGKRWEARRLAADQIIQYLNRGKKVGFVTLGDPTTYSTYMYVHDIIVGRGFETGIIPGVTSYSAAAAALGLALCEGDAILTIIPAAHSENIDEMLEYPGNKVVMKSGDNLARVLTRLKERGYGDRTKIAYRVSLDGQRLYTSIEDYEKSPETGYFTIVIVSMAGE